MKNQYITSTELAQLLGISRVAVFKKIKNKQIPAKKVGRNFVIHKSLLPELFPPQLTSQEKQLIERVIKNVLKEYEETLRLLGKE